jgi:organic hydroperoxide reductase OsmC/OhrA
MATYEATVKWQRGADEAFTDQRYSRRHHWLFDGGADIIASSSPHSVKAPFSDSAAVDPEEALVAALSSCHMLFFLSFAARRGFKVASYTGKAVGEMSREPSGKEWLSRVTLRPEIIFDGEKRPTAAEVDEMHHVSHEACYIANSIKSEILIEGKAAGLAD